MNNRILIFDTEITGHHLEYVHHLYEKAILRDDDSFIFVLPLEFLKLKKEFSWKSASNVEFNYINKKELEYCENCGRIISSFRKSLLLRKKAIKYNVNAVFLIMFMSFSPFLFFLLPPKVKVSGIIYRIYLYRWKQSKLLKRIQDVIKYKLIVYSSRVEKIFILNDCSSVASLNKVYSTDKFRFLVDPIFERGGYVRNLRNELNIPITSNVYLHFGALDKRKGTLDILDCIEMLPMDYMEKSYFIFAGKVHREIEKTFYEKIDKLKLKTHIIVFDEFCKYNLLSSLCQTSDCILVPYKNTIQSSGVIGYSALYKTPVICSGEGLLGKIVRKNHLGITVFNIDASSLMNAIVSFDLNYKVSNKYMDTNKLEYFADNLLVF